MHGKWLTTPALQDLRYVGFKGLKQLSKEKCELLGFKEELYVYDLYTYTHLYFCNLCYYGSQSHGNPC